MQTKVYLFSTSSHPKAISINSLDIQLFKPDIDFSIYDYFIITSKQVSEVLKQYDLKQYQNIKALCVSKQSALAYEKISGEILDIGKGYGDTLVDKVLEYPQETKWLYLRAKEVASDFISVLKKNHLVDEIIVYESKCSKEIIAIKVEHNATLIFTSPSSVKCYLKNKNINKLNRVIVIGKTTAKALPRGVKYIISSDTTIESCLEEIC